MPMTASSLRTLAILVVIAGTLICNNDVIIVSAQCGGSIPDMISQCEQYVQKTGPTTRPSAACCTELRKFDVKCMCQFITQNIIDLISVPKAIFVARTCGLNLPHEPNVEPSLSREGIEVENGALWIIC